MSIVSRLDWANWVYGLFAGFIGGGAGAVVSGITVSAVDPTDFNFTTGKFYILVATIFLTNGVLNMFAYLHQNPLPKVETTTTTTIETTEIKEKPKATVVTTVEKVEKKGQ